MSMSMVRESTKHVDNTPEFNLGSSLSFRSALSETVSIIWKNNEQLQSQLLITCKKIKNWKNNEQLLSIIWKNNEQLQSQLLITCKKRNNNYNYCPLSGKIMNNYKVSSCSCLFLLSIIGKNNEQLQSQLLITCKKIKN